MGHLTGWRRDGERAFIKAEARPGETWEHVSLRLRDDCTSDGLTTSLARLGKSIARAEHERSASGQLSSLRRAPADDVQSDFFVPALYDIGTRDNRSMMDVAVFRLSKDQKRAGGIIRYDLPDGYVEVKAGADGMASVWDYDCLDVNLPPYGGDESLSCG